MKLTNTYISKDCTRKCLVHTDKNGFYLLMRLHVVEGAGWEVYLKGRTHFKHIESLNRAVNKFIH